MAESWSGLTTTGCPVASGKSGSTVAPWDVRRQTVVGCGRSELSPAASESPLFPLPARSAAILGRPPCITVCHTHTKKCSVIRAPTRHADQLIYPAANDPSVRSRYCQLSILKNYRRRHEQQYPAGEENSDTQGREQNRYDVGDQSIQHPGHLRFSLSAHSRSNSLTCRRKVRPSCIKE